MDAIEATVRIIEAAGQAGKIPSLSFGPSSPEQVKGGGDALGTMFAATLSKVVAAMSDEPKKGQ